MASRAGLASSKFRSMMSCDLGQGPYVESLSLAPTAAGWPTLPRGGCQGWPDARKAGALGAGGLGGAHHGLAPPPDWTQQREPGKPLQGHTTTRSPARSTARRGTESRRQPGERLHPASPINHGPRVNHGRMGEQGGRIGGRASASAPVAFAEATCRKNGSCCPGSMQAELQT